MSMATTAGVDRFEPFGGLDSVRDYVIPEPITRGGVVDATPTVFVIDGDISMRKSLDLLLSGLDLQNCVAGDRSATPVIFITAYDDVRMSVPAMKAGAVEFLTKRFGDETLLAGIREALECSRRVFERETRTGELRESFASVTPVDMSDAAREVIALPWYDLQRQSVVHAELAADLPTVTGDRTQHRQVVLNLLRNGCDAMSGVDDRPRQLATPESVGNGRRS